MSQRYLDAFAWLRRILQATVRARPLMKIWRWIDSHVSIPVIVGSPNPGPMRTDRFPVYRTLYELLQLPHIHFFTFCASARVGKTLLTICYLLWRISERLGPALWLDPTRKTAMRLVRQELDPFIRECAPVWAKAIVSKTTWTALEKQFRGLQLRIVGSGSPADLAGYQAETVVINESDRVRAVVDREAASADLAIERSKQFESTRMILRNSTPTREDGDIWQNFLRGSKLYCYITCPHCVAKAAVTKGKKKKGKRKKKPAAGKRRRVGLQRLTFWSETVEVPFDPSGYPLPAGEVRPETTGRVRFDQFRQTERVEVEPGKFEVREKGFDIEQVRVGATYQCAYCQTDIEHFELNELLTQAEAELERVFAELRELLDAGQISDFWNTFNAKMAASALDCIWLAHNVKAPADHCSSHLSALYSPFERWGAIAVKFIQARGSLSKLVALYTLDLGIPFIHAAAAVRDSDIDRLINRCPKKYLKRQLPFRPEILTMTVDVQAYQFWWSIRAHGILWDHPDKPYWSALIDWGEAVSWEQIEEFAGLREDKQKKWNRYLWREEDGTITEFQVTAGLIDSGFEAQENKNVYEFCSRWSEVFSPSKGGDESKTRGATMRLSPILNDSQDLVWYWDSFFKQGLYQHCVRLGINGAGEPMYWWVPADVDAEYRTHLCSERLEEKDGKRVWVCKGPNHLADTEKMHEVLKETIWDSLEEIRDEAEKKSGAEASAA